MPLWRALVTYPRNDDPLAEAANRVALIVASNQPFYPLYLYWLVDHEIALSCLTLLSTPLFLAVPAVARLSSRAGRALLPLAGYANTALCMKIFGPASGVALFLAPCLLLATLSFRPEERRVMVVVAGLGFLVLFAGEFFGPPLQVYADAAYPSFFKLNAFSVATLSAFIGFAFANAFARGPAT
jgi:hypothetical protein